MVKHIPLNHGLVAVVDDDDYEALSRFKWHASFSRNGRVYARRRRLITEGPGRVTTLMHRQITQAADGVVIDHRDRDGLNNQRANLRFATGAQNKANSRKPVTALTSNFKGVSWDRPMKRWRAAIGVDGRNYGLGFFESETDAAHAYDTAAHVSWGEYALLNFPNEPLNETLLRQVTVILNRPAGPRNQWNKGEGWVDRICSRCGTIFQVRRYRLKIAPQRWYCSPNCYRHGPRVPRGPRSSRPIEACTSRSVAAWSDGVM